MSQSRRSASPWQDREPFVPAQGKPLFTIISGPRRGRTPVRSRRAGSPPRPELPKRVKNPKQPGSSQQRYSGFVLEDEPQLNTPRPLGRQEPAVRTPRVKNPGPSRQTYSGFVLEDEPQLRPRVKNPKPATQSVLSRADFEFAEEPSDGERRRNNFIADLAELRSEIMPNIHRLLDSFLSLFVESGEIRDDKVYLIPEFNEVLSRLIFAFNSLAERLGRELLKGGLGMERRYFEWYYRTGIHLHALIQRKLRAAGRLGHFLAMFMLELPPPPI